MRDATTGDERGKRDRAKWGFFALLGKTDVKYKEVVDSYDLPQVMWSEKWSFQLSGPLDQLESPFEGRKGPIRKVFQNLNSRW